MDINELKSRFLQSRDFATDNVNELLDFAKKAYIHNEITIKEYRHLVGDLEAHGAVIPDSQTDNPLIGEVTSP
jgi:hypothetical protein